MKSKINWTAMFVGVVAMLLCTIGMFAVADMGIDWSTWEPATSMMADGGYNFGEQVIEGSAIRQPWNTYSSFYYVFVGAFLLGLPYTKKEDKSLSITSSKALRILFSFAIIVTGVGSAFMHMSMTFYGQVADVLGMYLVSVFIVMYALRNNPKFNATLFTILYVIINAVLLFALWFMPEVRRNLFLVLILIGLVMEHFCNRKVKGYSSDMLMAAACSLGFAYVLWQLDNHRGIFFDQVGWLQGHHFWHLGGAAACGLIYLHYSRNYMAAHPDALPAKK